MNHSEQINELAAALAKAQAEMKAADMNATNPFLKNRYADLGSIIEAVRPAIAKHGLAFAQMPTFDGATVTVDTIIMHASGQWLSSTLGVSIEGEKGLSLAQVMGKAITYLRRYGLSAMFGVYADKDDDGNGAGPDSAQHVEQRKAQAPAGDVPNCPKCGGAMWDNRGTPEKPKTNPRAPDYKCKDKTCDGVIWPPKDNGNGPAPEPAATGTPKLAAIKTPNFARYATAFAVKHPRYANKAGGFDDAHICASIAKLGYADITPENIDSAFKALDEHAQEQTALPLN